MSTRGLLAAIFALSCHISAAQLDRVPGSDHMIPMFRADAPAGVTLVKAGNYSVLLDSSGKELYICTFFALEWDDIIRLSVEQWVWLEETGTEFYGSDFEVW